MGGDGGSIPRRIELVKTRPKAEIPDAAAQSAALWFFCALSKEPLSVPIVSCNLGKLYNKDAIIRYLLDRDAFGDADRICPHITKMRDVVELKLSHKVDAAVPSGSDEESSGSNDGSAVVKFVCPVTMKEMNGKNKFSFIWSCGCVLSDQAFKTIPSTTCLNCSKPVVEDDIIPLNATSDSEINRLHDRLSVIREKRSAEDAEKAAKKRAAKGGDSKKRKGAAAEHGEPVGEKRKKANEVVETERDNINMHLPKLDDALVPKHMRVHSNAVKSLYAKKGADAPQDNFLCRGTFNRYAGGF
ncbi:Rtf2 RING-finger-domain-containing protein [Cladochytrium replicatum]|nr:Rtf2 RING-finger-domain-containing protein [Cladochytrium replicatum]